MTFNVWEVLIYCVSTAMVVGGTVYILMANKLFDTKLDYEMLRHRFRIITGEKP